MSLPTNEEQELLEIINRLRLDPAGEFDRLILDAANRIGVTNGVTGAINFFNVDLTLFRQQMLAFNAVAPLAWHTALADAAQQHSAQMILTDTQSHQLPGEPDLGQRAINNGYNFSTLGENIFAFASSVIFGHAGFVIDWGFGPGGMQTPAGHRNSLLSGNFSEIGIDITHENNPATSVGPLVITQDLGNRFNYAPQVLGVVFDDTDGDGFYDAGEGTGGLTVTLVGTPGTFTTTTWATGGYQIVVPQSTYTLTFSGPGLPASRTTQVTLGGANVKLDINLDIPGTPSAPSRPDVSADTDTGASKSDNITNIKTPVLTGTAAPLTTITLFDGATAIGSGSAGADGKWSIKANSLADGKHSITAKASNGGGTSGASLALSVTIDSVTPSAPGIPDLTVASDTGVSNSDNLTRLTAPTFFGKAEANATVTLLEEGTPIGSAKANAAGSWLIKSNTLADGVHAISAQATDIAGNVSVASAAVLVTIDATGPAAPTVPNMTPLSDSGVSTADNITKVTTPTFIGSAEAGTTVTLFKGGSALGTAKASAGGIWSIKSAALADGSHVITARASDPAGNLGIPSAGLTVTVDTAAPVTSPVVGSLSTKSISGTAEANSIVTLFDNSVAMAGTIVASATGVWTKAIALTPGTHTITARSTDRAGNVGAIQTAGVAVVGSAAADVLADVPGPTLMAGGAGSDTYHVGNAADVITESAAEGAGDTVLAKVSYTIGAASRIEFLTADTGAPGLALGGNGFINTITGGAGNDTLIGGGGADLVIGGGGADLFVMMALSDSTAVASGRDRVGDFSVVAGDRIDLQALDADSTVVGDQAFSFLGSAALTGKAGQLVQGVFGADTRVQGDVNGDGVADFSLLLTGSVTLGVGSFVL